MAAKFCFIVITIFFCAASARYIPASRRYSAAIPYCQEMSLLSTINDLIDLTNALDSPCDCGCKGKIPSPCGCGKTCNCNKPCFVDVILPPTAAELPCGLGYLPSAAPLVANAFGATSACDACVPLTSPYTCTCLATPMCPELRAYAKPIIL